MKGWPNRIGEVLGMGLIWALLWGAVGVLIEIMDPAGAMDPLWLGPPIGMLPGFLGGVIFAALEIAVSRRRLGPLPISMGIVCGGIAGLLVGVLPFAINELPDHVPFWLVGAVVVGSMTLLGAVTAAGLMVVAGRVRPKIAK